MNAPYAYPNAKPKKKLSRLLPIGLALVVLGFLVAIPLGYFGLRNVPDPASYQRVSGQGQPVELTSGEWTIFAEGGGRARPTEIVGPDGQSIVIASSIGSQNYNIGGVEGVAVGRMTAPTDGQYLVTTEPGQTNAFSQSFASSLLASLGFVLVAIFVGGGLIAVGIFLWVIGIFKWIFSK